MGEPQVSRWRRYGKDRLYVNTDTGQRIGWVDLVTGTQTLEDASRAEEFQKAVARFCVTHGLPQPTDCAPPGVTGPRPLLPEPAAQTSATLPTPAQVVAPSSRAPAPMPRLPPTKAVPSAHDRDPTPAWVDLSLNVPGQAARAQADAELAAMRDRSRVGTFLVRTFDMKTEERAWRVGAGGEETIGAKLEKLRKHGWHVLHAIPVGDRGSDIDHVVIGPGGVWTLNTKTHPGKNVWVGKHQVRVDGHKTDYLRNSRHEADRSSLLLSEACGFPVHVKAALVFLTGTLIPNVTIKNRHPRTWPSWTAWTSRVRSAGPKPGFRRTGGRHLRSGTAVHNLGDLSANPRCANRCPPQSLTRPPGYLPGAALPAGVTAWLSTESSDSQRIRR